jgi:hypothetical protein
MGFFICLTCAFSPFRVFHFRCCMKYNNLRLTLPGEVAERLKAAVSKIVMGVTPSGVRIPPSPPVIFCDTLGLTT